MSFKIESFVPPLAAKFHGTLPKSPQSFIPPLAAKLAPPVRSAAVVAAVIPERLNPKQAAAYLGVSAPTMRKLAAGIPHLRLGRLIRFDRQALDDVLRGKEIHRRAA